MKLIIQKRSRQCNKIILFVTILFQVTALSGCKKFVEIDGPIDQIDSKVVFNSDQTAEAAVNGIYSNMLVSQLQVNNSALTIYAGLCSDELYYYTPGTLDAFSTNKISLANHGDIESKFWTPLYKYIYASNACIEGLEASKQVSEPLSTTLKGEARLLRAFCYFQLTNLFGKVPLITTTDFATNSIANRSEESAIYDQIKEDLAFAVQALPNDPANGERTRPGKDAARALLSKVYLYTKEWDKVIETASEVISAGYQLSDPASTFLFNSQETIWQFKPVNPARNTFEAREIVPSSGGAMPTYLLNEPFVLTFGSGDKRIINWIGSREFAGQTIHYPYKYKVRGGTGVPQTEYIIVFRLAEQLLIRAEANANLGKLSDAISDIDKIRQRAGIALLSVDNPGITKEDLLLAIEQERMKELFVEWGNRWFDLKRTGRANAILGTLKPTWASDAVLWPVPESEILKNSNLLPQNTGY
jgi:hypothetical protein